MDDIWQGDKLGRQQDGDTIYRFIMSQVATRQHRGARASYVLNINAEWGHGKSFFLDRFATQIRYQGNVVARVNAWENDLANEPMIAVMAAIEDALKPYLSPGSKVRKKWKNLMKSSAPLAVSLVKGVASSFLKKHTGEFMDDVTDAVTSEGKDEDEGESAVGEGVAAVIDKLGDDLAAGMIEAHNQHIKSISTFRENLAAIAASIRTEENPDALIFVLVDELDRCRPNHAINLLEAIKHLFNTDGVVFVLATNTDQLAASIKAVYGAEFKAREYLLRFFDRSYVFRDVPIGSFVSFLVSTYGINPETCRLPEVDGVTLSEAFFKSAGLTFRDIEQCFEIFGTLFHLWREPVPLQLSALWPLIIAHHKGNTAAFRALSADPRNDALQAIFTNPVTLLRQRVHTGSGSQFFTETADVIQVAEAFLRGTSYNLPELSEPSTKLARTAASRYFGIELSARYPGGYNPRETIPSVVRKYPDMVSLTAQFEPTPVTSE